MEKILKSTKQIASICASLALALSMWPAAAQAEALREFHAEIVITPQAELQVTERVEYEFSVQRHGYVRGIPVQYRAENGNTVSIGITPVQVLRNGEESDFHTKKEGKELVFYTGNEYEYVSGVQQYQLEYTVERALLGFKDHDELYWNVTGFEGPTTPGKASATVRLPGGVRPQDVQVRCWTGQVGSTEQNCAASVQPDGTVVAQAENEWLTIAVAFPKGVVTMPGILAKISWFLRDNWVLFLPLLTAAFMAFWWYVHGRDPERRALTVQYEPLNNLSPGILGTLLDDTVHEAEFSAVIIDLAVRGYLKIKEDGKDFVITRTEKSHSDLQEFEKEIAEAFLGGAQEASTGSLSSRAKNFLAHKTKAEELIYQELTARKWYGQSPAAVRGIYYGIASVVVFGAFFLGEGMSAATFFSLLATAGIIAGFGTIMPRRTPGGAQAFEHVLGLKEYMSKAEKYRLQWAEKEKIFEKLLPYAMAFGVVEFWTKALASSITKNPDWYSGSRPNAFDALYFSRSMNNFSSSVHKQMAAGAAAASGKSGFSSGGGMSGGGFGGGRSGSW